jgi:hypothetical protein
MTDAVTAHEGSGNSTTLVEPATGLALPAMIAAAGEHARLRFIDFFTAHIRNPSTRAAYCVAVRAFFDWLTRRLRFINEHGAAGLLRATWPSPGKWRAVACPGDGRRRRSLISRWIFCVVGAFLVDQGGRNGP